MRELRFSDIFTTTCFLTRLDTQQGLQDSLRTANTVHTGSFLSSPHPPYDSINRALTMAGEGGDKPHRDVKNHLLFEIATEVAHRGTTGSLYWYSQAVCPAPQLTLCDSWWYLLGAQIKSPSDHSRIWRQIHSDRPSQPPIGKSGHLALIFNALADSNHRQPSRWKS